MERLLDQSSSYTTIKTYKNYCNISEKGKIIKDLNLCNDIFNVESPTFTIYPTNKIKKNLLFYKLSEQIKLIPSTGKDIIFFTTNDRIIKRHYNNPFSSLIVYYTRRTITLKGNKLIIRVFYQSKYRDVNFRYFRKSQNTELMSIDLKNGNFLLFYENGNSKSKKFVVNNFNLLYNFINKNFFIDFDQYSKVKSSEGSIDNLLRILDDKVFITKLNVDDFLKFPYTDRERLKILFDGFIEFFVRKSGIKVPNDYVELIRYQYPGKNILKKYNFNLIHAILGEYKIKTKNTIKILNENPRINVPLFINTCKLLGKNFHHYIGKINPKVFEFNIKNNNSSYTNHLILSDRIHDIDNLTKKEQYNVFMVLNDILNDSMNTKSVFAGKINIIGEILDHFRLIRLVKKYDETASFSATNLTEFNIEHLRYSDLSNKIKRGWSIELIFDETMLKDIESEFVALKDYDTLSNFKPVILKRDEEYTEEGKYMHHCVGSYVNNENSIIISLRMVNSDDRVTCEYSNVNGVCFQSRYFSNTRPPEHFKDALFILHDKVKKYARYGLLRWKEKIKVPIKINGKMIDISDRQPTIFGLPLVVDEENLF